MPFFSAKSKSSQGSAPSMPKRIYSEREIEEKIMSLPRELQLRTLSVYQLIGKFEASLALSNLKMAREDVQDLERELQRHRLVEDELQSVQSTETPDPASFHTVVTFKKQLRKAPGSSSTSAELRVEDETEFNQ